jgi:hypothetical protein
MEEKYQVGDFGCAEFVAKKGWKAPTTCYGRIMAIENRIVLFIDNDENEYLIPKSKFKFEKHEFKIKS